MNDTIILELIHKQLKNIDIDNKLTYNDINRLRMYLTTSIFDEKECSLWKGYAPTIKYNTHHIDFYLNKKKKTLYRLLYINYIGPLNSNEYVKSTCENKGLCCNINHFIISHSKS
jgi:hypothetical protein